MNNDWAFLRYYKAGNAELIRSDVRVETVFLGDSITEGWRKLLPGFFPSARVNRGIGGQTTPQMLVRFRQDVIALRPAIVHIMAGTNDIAGNTGPMTAEETLDNLKTMTEIAMAHGIKVILASIPPGPWPGIDQYNQAIKSYAQSVGAAYADYFSVLNDGRGGLRQTCSEDTIHPNLTGYLEMVPVAEQVLLSFSL